MNSRNKLTDEQLAAMIEHCFGDGALKFDDVDTFEAVNVASRAMELIDEDVLQPIDFSFTPPSFSMCEPVAMCGFLGDDFDGEVLPDDDFDGEVPPDDDFDPDDNELTE